MTPEAEALVARCPAPTPTPGQLAHIRAVLTSNARRPGEPNPRAAA